MKGIPSQAEIDAVAHYIEAALELRRSPFFIEEYRNLSLSTREGAPNDEMKGRYPDPNVVSAMLIPFRRLWQHNEPCNYRRVANILKKYMPEIRSLMDSLLITEEQSVVRKMPYVRNIDLPLKDVIDMWLNTRYLHVGEQAGVGRFSRQDFERFRKKVGAVLFEFYFLTAAHEVGMCFLNIQQFAESFLQKSEHQGLASSIALQADPNDMYIQRETPGFTPDQYSKPLLRISAHDEDLSQSVIVVDLSGQKNIYRFSEISIENSEKLLCESRLYRRYMRSSFLVDLRLGGDWRWRVESMLIP